MPTTKADLPTPALLIDLDAFEANIRHIFSQCRAAGVSLRPHAKTHKCVEIGRRLMAAGAVGISTATVAEAEAMVRGGIKGVLLTSPIVEANKIDRMLALVERDPTVMLSIGHKLELDRLAARAAETHRTVNVLIDLDVGDRRTGVFPGEAALELAQAVKASGNVKLRGLQAYAGHSSHVKGYDERVKSSQTAVGKAVETRKLLERHGFDVPILSVGSTGTYDIDSRIAGVSDLQCGSFLFMDNHYRMIGGRGSAVYEDFKPSLFVLTTVISSAHTDRVTVDAGIKAVSTCVQAVPEPKDRPGLHHKWTGDEFGIITADAGVALPKLGDRLEFIVPHCDPTVNLYDRVHACRGDNVEAVWTISARRETPLV